MCIQSCHKYPKPSTNFKEKIVIRELRNLNQLTNFNSIYVLGLGPSFNHSLVGSMLITFACSEEMAEDMVGERGDQKNTKMVRN